MTIRDTSGVIPGLEVCLEAPPELLQAARLAVLVHPASLSRAFEAAGDLLATRFPGQIRKLLTPQHGLFSEQQDNMRETAHGFHRGLGVPVYSLYSETRRPTAEMLDDVDVLVVDLQDVGCRVYTYIWTLTYCMEECARRGLPVLILDRPHPLGAPAVEGPPLDDAFRSFVGRAPIPLLHDLTLGELARHLNERMGIGCHLEVVPLRGFDRRPAFRETGLSWWPPSPNLPRTEGVDWYPGMVLLEGTNVSEGRGTTTPFEVVGAPFIDPEALRDVLQNFRLPGIRLRSLRFLPTFQKWQGQSCGGLGLHLLERESYRPVRTALALLSALRTLYPDQFEWTSPPYEYEERLLPIDILYGSSRLREAVDGGRLLSDRELDALVAVDEGVHQRETAAARLYPVPRSTRTAAP